MTDKSFLIGELQACLDVLESAMKRQREEHGEDVFMVQYRTGEYFYIDWMLKKADLIWEINSLEEELKAESMNEENFSTEVTWDEDLTRCESGCVCGDVPDDDPETPNTYHGMSWPAWSKSEFFARPQEFQEYWKKANPSLVVDRNEAFRGSRFDPDHGLQPKISWLNERLQTINSAIQIRLQDMLPIPNWWNKERAELIEQIKRGS